MDSAVEEPQPTATDRLTESPSQHVVSYDDAAVGDDDDDVDDETATLDAAADFIGLVRDNDAETLRLGVERFGAERARVLCCTVETRLGGLTAFTLAAELGHQQIIALFIELGADVNSKNATGGWTPLHCAVSQGFMQVLYIRLSTADLLTATYLLTYFTYNVDILDVPVHAGF